MQANCGNLRVNEKLAFMIKQFALSTVQPSRYSLNTTSTNNFERNTVVYPTQTKNLLVGKTYWSFPQDISKIGTPRIHY